MTDGRKFFAKDSRGTLPAGTLGAPDIAVVNGGYYEGQVPARAAALVDNSRARTRLTELSDRLVR